MLSSDLMPWDFALILIFLGTAVPLLGRRRLRRLMQAPQTTKTERLVLYGSTIVFQWLAVAVIVWRTRAHGISPGRLGLAVTRPGITAIVSIALVALILLNQLVSLRRLATNPAEMRGILPQLALKVFPQDTGERLAFSGLVLTVAFCEELIFRGFAQRVFEDAGNGILTVGVVGSALLFSIAHLYQGRRGLISTLIVGLLFSIVRAWTGSLLPGAVAHFVADIIAGFFAPSRVRNALLAADAQQNADIYYTHSNGNRTL